MLLSVCFLICRSLSVLFISSLFVSFLLFFFFKQKTAYEMRISDWSSDVCSSDLGGRELAVGQSRMAPGRDEMIDERRDVAAPVAQRRQRHRDHVEAVEEILAEPAIGNQAAHVAVGRGDDAHKIGRAHV